jgi:hypothetical protein
MWNTVLLDQLDPTDPEDAEVRAIILRVQQKALKQGGNLPNFNEESSQRADTHSEPVTILLPVGAKPDGRSRRRKYASRADQQRAYRERKAALKSA